MNSVLKFRYFRQKVSFSFFCYLLFRVILGLRVLTDIATPFLISKLRNIFPGQRKQHFLSNLQLLNDILLISEIVTQYLFHNFGNILLVLIAKYSHTLCTVLPHSVFNLINYDWYCSTLDYLKRTKFIFQDTINSMF